jgi:hypothetical protein
MAIASATQPGAAGRSRAQRVAIPTNQTDRALTKPSDVSHQSKARQLPPRVEFDNYKASYLRM